MESTPEHERVIAVGAAPTVATDNLPSLPLQLPTNAYTVSNAVSTEAQRVIGGIMPDSTNEYIVSRHANEEGEDVIQYKAIEPFTVRVKVGDLRKVIDIDSHEARFTEGSNKGTLSRCFRDWLSLGLPPHCCPSFDQAFSYPFISVDENHKNRGRPRKTGRLCIGYSHVYCSQKAKGCPTTLYCGFVAEDLRGTLEAGEAEEVDLRVDVQNACRHVGQSGELRGNARQLRIDEFIRNPKMAPRSHLHQMLDSASNDQLMSNNLAHAPNSNQVYNLSREAALKRRKMKGLCGDTFQNIFLAAKKSEEKDKKMRKGARDTSQDLLGIARSVTQLPVFEVCLWSKQMCMIYHELVKTNKLAVFIDGTGGLTNMRQVASMKDKLVHVAICISPASALLANPILQSDENIIRDMSPVILAERISDVNNAESLASFYKRFSADCHSLAKDGFGQQNPLISITDCAVALQSASLEAFATTLWGRNGQVLPKVMRIEYINIMHQHLLYLDHMLSLYAKAESTVLWEKCNGILHNLGWEHHVTHFLKECKSHVYRAPPQWIKRKKREKHLSSYDANLLSRLDDFFKMVFDDLLTEDRFSVVVVKVCILIALFQCEEFDLTEPLLLGSAPQEHKEKLELEEEMALTSRVSAFIEEQSRMMEIGSLAEVNTNLRNNPTKESVVSNAFYAGVINDAKTLVKKQCCAYVKSVVEVPTGKANAKSAKGNAVQAGIIVATRFSIIFGCGYKKSKDGEKAGAMVAWKFGGLEHSRTMSIDEAKQNSEIKHVPNPFFSGVVSTYLEEYWMRHVGIWSRSVIVLLNTAHNIKLRESNQLSEGKTYDRKKYHNVHEHIDELGCYMHHRDDRSRSEARLFAQQCRLLPGKAKQVLGNRAKKQKKISEQLTQDQQYHAEEEGKGEVWSRVGSPTEIQLQLKARLVAAFESADMEIEQTNIRAKHQEVEKFCAVHRPHQSISYHTFRKFMNGERGDKPLNNVHFELLNAFCDHCFLPSNEVGDDDDDSQAEQIEAGQNPDISNIPYNEV